MGVEHFPHGRASPHKLCVNVINGQDIGIVDSTIRRSGHSFLNDMCLVMRRRFDATVLEQERTMRLFQARSTHWGKNTKENIEEYALHFRTQTMDFIPKIILPLLE